MGGGYDDDLKKARNIMMKEIQAQPLVLEDLAASMLMTELTDSSVNFLCALGLKQVFIYIKSVR
jgi:small conductance mechanosensitive channel